MNILHVVEKSTLMNAVFLILSLIGSFAYSLEKNNTQMIIKSSKEIDPQNMDSTKSYSEWKNLMIESAQEKVTKIKLKLEAQRRGSKLNFSELELRYQLAKEQLQVALATELSISDYFVGYLHKQDNIQSAIKNISGKLSKEEVTELMIAYSMQFKKTRSALEKTASDAASKSELN